MKKMHINLNQVILQLIFLLIYYQKIKLNKLEKFKFLFFMFIN